MPNLTAKLRQKDLSDCNRRIQAVIEQKEFKPLLEGTHSWENNTAVEFYSFLSKFGFRNIFVENEGDDIVCRFKLRDRKCALSLKPNGTIWQQIGGKL